MVNPAALMLGRGGVALEDAADAARCYPDLWPSPAAARQAFHRARRTAGPVEDDPGGGSRTSTACRLPSGRCRKAPRFPRLRPGDGARPPELAGGAGRTAGALRGGSRRRGAGDRLSAAWRRYGGGRRSRPPRSVPTASEPSTAPLTLVVARPPALPDRLRLSRLTQRLHDARPKRQHGVRPLDWAEWETAGRAAAELPSGEWSAWRAMVGTAAAGWPPRPPASLSAL